MKLKFALKIFSELKFKIYAKKYIRNMGLNTVHVEVTLKTMYYYRVFGVADYDYDNKEVSR